MNDKIGKIITLLQLVCISISFVLMMYIINRSAPVCPVEAVAVIRD